MQSIVKIAFVLLGDMCSQWAVENHGPSSSAFEYQVHSSFQYPRNAVCSAEIDMSIHIPHTAVSRFPT